VTVVRRGGPRGLVERTPLRVTLVGLLVALVVLALVGAGAVAAMALRGYLVGQVDDELTRVARSFGEGPGPVAPPPEAVGSWARPGPPSDFFVRYLDAEGATTGEASNPIGDDAAAPDLPALSLAEVRATAGVPFTVEGVDGSAPWRVIATPLPGGTGSLLVAQSLAEVEATVRQLAVVELAVGAAVVLLLVVVGHLLVRRSLRPLAEVEQAAGEIAAGDLSRRVPERDPRTEVGSLARSFNGMVDRIETAFRRQADSEAAARESERRMRRFVADASHELRTPLTSIRGFAELYRQGAVADRAGVDRAMGRIESEAGRMGLLVDDLLLLARLDQHRPLAHDPVDLLDLAADAVEDARAVQPGRPVELVVAPGDRPPIVSGDQPSLRQVLSNLMSNALRYTPESAAVQVRVGTRGDAAVLEVADEGPGLPPEAAERVFERFYRTDEARSRDDGGTGLGLAIVVAVVAEHGGSVELDTALGQGATFRVLLPLH
jgi:two-component system OmpR family sensor kinase